MTKAQAHVTVLCFKTDGDAQKQQTTEKQLSRLMAGDAAGYSAVTCDIGWRTHSDITYYDLNSDILFVGHVGMHSALTQFQYE